MTTTMRCYTLLRFPMILAGSAGLLAGCSGSHSTFKPPPGYIRAELTSGEGGRLITLPTSGTLDPNAPHATWTTATRPATSARRLTVHFAEGPTGCGQARTIDVAETRESVTIEVTLARPVTSKTECTEDSYPVSASVTLTAPLGTRVLLQPAAGQ